MQRRTLVSSLIVSALVVVSLSATGCKKDEPKVETVAPVQTSQPAAAPQPAAVGGMFMAQISVDNAPQTMKAGATITLPVKVKNTSSENWKKDKASPINLSYHWKNEADKKVVTWDGIRTLISKDVASGEEITLNVKVASPKVGKYILELDMVMDTPNGGWFGRKGSQIASMPVSVK
ncbi:MAG: hypothetical protein JJE30_03650 [Desulfuromonadales bacterium]|nr:hypothetical protein [Desulfuromonadales bacterium]